MAARYDFPSIIRGDARTLAVFLRIKDPQTLSRAPFPLEGYGFKLTMSPPGQNALVRTEASGLSLDPATGGIVTALSSTDTQAMPVGAVPYRISVADAAGGVNTVLRGNLFFED